MALDKQLDPEIAAVLATFSEAQRQSPRVKQLLADHAVIIAQLAAEKSTEELLTKRPGANTTGFRAANMKRS